MNPADELAVLVFVTLCTEKLQYELDTLIKTNLNELLTKNIHRIYFSCTQASTRITLARHEILSAKRVQFY